MLGLVLVVSGLGINIVKFCFLFSFGCLGYCYLCYLVGKVRSYELKVFILVWLFVGIMIWKSYLVFWS